jgi:hypothetical protein
MTGRRGRAALGGAVLAALIAAAAAQDAADPAGLWELREAQRFENQRRDCAAQWEGAARKGQAGAGPREAFIAECTAAARTARCHPPGHNPTCRYEARERRGGGTGAAAP